MSVHDPIANMLSGIRNGQVARKNIIFIPFSKIKQEISFLLVQEGYIKASEVITSTSTKPVLRLELKYFQGRPVISLLQRVSRPGLRIYRKNIALPKIMSGLGIAIISTSKGIKTDKVARHDGLGGEVICYVA